MQRFLVIWFDVSIIPYLGDSCGQFIYGLPHLHWGNDTSNPLKNTVWVRSNRNKNTKTRQNFTCVRVSLDARYGCDTVRFITCIRENNMWNASRDSRWYNVMTVINVMGYCQSPPTCFVISLFSNTSWLTHADSWICFVRWPTFQMPYFSSKYVYSSSIICGRVISFHTMRGTYAN